MVLAITRFSNNVAAGIVALTDARPREVREAERNHREQVALNESPSRSRHQHGEGSRLQEAIMRQEQAAIAIAVPVETSSPRVYAAVALPRSCLDANQCSVCSAAVSTTACVPCGHVCLCDRDAKALSNGGVCPLCNTPAQSTLRVYMS